MNSGQFLGVVLLGLGLSGLGAAENGARQETFRMGISHRSLGPVNRNDAAASLKVWAATVMQESKLLMPIRVDLVEDANQLRAGLARGTLHGVSMTTEELVTSGEEPEAVYLPVKGRGYGEQYLLLVRRDAGTDDLQALRGRSLARHVSATTSTAMPWLETKLADQGIGPARQFLGPIEDLENPSKAVLRVFFGQADACLVTSNAFSISCELNPQVAKKLKPLAGSPPLVPTVLYFRNNYQSPQLLDIETAILGLHKTTIGQQVLTIFQATRLEKLPASCLKETKEIIARYRQLGLGIRLEGGAL